jgi:hypothetical protein
MKNHHITRDTYRPSISRLVHMVWSGGTFGFKFPSSKCKSDSKNWNLPNFEYRQKWTKDKKTVWIVCNDIKTATNFILKIYIKALRSVNSTRWTRLSRDVNETKVFSQGLKVLICSISQNVRIDFDGFEFLFLDYFLFDRWRLESKRVLNK